MIKKKVKIKKFLIYDSNCLMCEGFLNILDIIFDNKNLNLYVASNPNMILNFNKKKSFDTFLKDNLNYFENIRFNTIIYLEENKIYIRYQAIIKILKDSDHKFIKPFVIILNLLIPKFLGDFIYKLIAKNRNKISWIFYRNKCQLNFKNLNMV